MREINIVGYHSQVQSLSKFFRHYLTVPFHDQPDASSAAKFLVERSAEISDAKILQSQKAGTRFDIALRAGKA